MSTQEDRLGPTATLTVVWALVGVLALLGSAVWRLTPLAIEPIRNGTLGTWDWVLYGASIVFLGWSEGYRGFHLQFSPRCVARALYLGRRGTRLQRVLAPAHAMGLFHATRRRLIVAWSILIGVTLLVILMRRIEQPWRGIVDAGVVVGLALGGATIVYHAVRVLSGRAEAASADLPG